MRKPIPDAGRRMSIARLALLVLTLSGIQHLTSGICLAQVTTNPGSPTYPVEGPAYAPSHAAVINSGGKIDAASGTSSNCVHVDGTSAVCGGAGATPGGDVTGALGSLTVTGVQGRPVVSTAPTNGQVYSWVSADNQWEPSSPAVGSPGGDVSGTLGSLTVIGIQGRAVSSTPPTNGQVLVWSTADSQYAAGSPTTGTPGGDLSGTLASATVVGIQGNAVASTAPTDGQVYSWVAADSQWEPGAPAVGSPGGDVSGTLGSLTVIKVQGKAVASTAPANGQVLVWVTADSQYEPQNQTGGTGGAAPVIDGSGTPVGQRAIINFIPGVGVGQAFSDDGSKINITTNSLLAQIFGAANTSGTVQQIGALCSPSLSPPCQIRNGASLFTMTAPVTATISGTSAGGTVYWYLSSAQVLTAGHNSVATLMCSAGCSVVTGITAFPPDSVPLWQTTFTANAWNAVTPAMDARAYLDGKSIAAGSGIMSAYNPTSGVQTISTDPLAVPRYFTGSGTPSANCTAGRDFYTDTVGLALYYCDAANTWAAAGGGGSISDNQTFQLASSTTGTGSALLAASANNNAGYVAIPAPGGLSGTYVGDVALYGSGNYVMVQKRINPLWTVSGVTSVTIALIASQQDGSPSAGNWNFDGYVGCTAAAGSTAVIFGTVSHFVAATPPTYLDMKTFAPASGLNIPASCVAGGVIQFWVLHIADSAGATGVGAKAIAIETELRGR